MHLRWAIRRDHSAILDIERDAFEFPWTHEELVQALRQRNCIGMVVEVNHEILGFMVYELYKARLRIVNIAVRKDARRAGIGTAMVGRLIDKLSQTKRTEIELEVRETNLNAQLFFQSHGFRCVSVQHDYYDHTNEDAYLFRYSVLESDQPTKFAPKNRISGLA